MKRRKFLFCEDNSHRLNEFDAFRIKLEQELVNTSDSGWDFLKAQDYPDALSRSCQLTDEDIISLDSQLKEERDAGVSLLIDLRRRGCRCFAIWHSGIELPSWAVSHCYKIENVEIKWGVWESLANEIATEYKIWLQNMRTAVFTLPSIGTQYLPALAILCQGYLITHCPAPTAVTGDAKRALDLMGWTNFIGAAGKKDIPDAWPTPVQTEKTEWWQEVCGQDRHILMQRLEEEIGKKLPSGIEDLINLLYKNDRLIPPPKTKKKKDRVAEIIGRAYLEIHDILS